MTVPGTSLKKEQNRRYFFSFFISLSEVHTGCPMNPALTRGYY